MLYKVFLVEDEIVTREGIRDNVDWKSVGFEFCGEAPDGEVALPLIEAAQPDVVITDIKMPFMDGLQLCKVVREHMPWIKIIVLSGHDEFEYAQASIKLGVTEYLLKPISAQDLQAALKRLTETLDRERQERESLKQLREDVAENLGLLREKFLVRLMMGGVSSADAIEQSQKFGLDLVAQYYCTILIKVILCESDQPFDYREYQQVERLTASLAGNNPNILLAKKDMEELVLLIKGDSPEQQQEDADFIVNLIKREIEDKTTCQLEIGIGTSQQRLSDIHYSFSEALAKVSAGNNAHLTEELPNELFKLDPLVVENYVKFGNAADFDAFFDDHLLPIGEVALRSYMVKHYIFIDVALTLAQFVSNLGGDVDQVIPEIHNIEDFIADVNSIEQMKAKLKGVFTKVLDFRNGHVNRERTSLLRQAKTYIDEHFSDPNLQMSQVAETVSLSASHFSSVFSQEMGVTFRDYVGMVRINKAKELLRTTNLKCSEVAYQSGYNDPHYFSYVFKKKTGRSPKDFRQEADIVKN